MLRLFCHYLLLISPFVFTVEGCAYRLCHFLGIFTYTYFCLFRYELSVLCSLFNYELSVFGKITYPAYKTLQKPASVAQLDAPSDWRPGGRGFNPRRGRQHSFVEIDHEIFSTVILSLPLIQERQLSVSGERMCTILVNRLED